MSSTSGELHHVFYFKRHILILPTTLTSFKWLTVMQLNNLWLLWWKSRWKEWWRVIKCVVKNKWPNQRFSTWNHTTHHDLEEGLNVKFLLWSKRWLIGLRHQPQHHTRVCEMCLTVGRTTIVRSGLGWLMLGPQMKTLNQEPNVTTLWVRADERVRNLLHLRTNDGELSGQSQ